jgi:hypothetical protein
MVGAKPALTTPQRIDALMQMVGPATPDICSVLAGDDGHWLVHCASGIAVSIEAGGSGDKLLLMAVLGTVLPQRQLHVFRMLLAFNALYAESGRLTMAQQGHDGAVCLLHELGVDGLQAQLLGDACVELAQAARNWIGYVQCDRVLAPFLAPPHALHP